MRSRKKKATRKQVLDETIRVHYSTMHVRLGSLGTELYERITRYQQGTLLSQPGQEMGKPQVGEIGKRLADTGAALDELEQAMARLLPFVDAVIQDR